MLSDGTLTFIFTVGVLSLILAGMLAMMPSSGSKPSTAVGYGIAQPSATSFGVQPMD
jgi:hypothetical protein